MLAFDGVNIVKLSYLEIVFSIIVEVMFGIKKN